MMRKSLLTLFLAFWCSLASAQIIGSGITGDAKVSGGGGPVVPAFVALNSNIHENGSAAASNQVAVTIPSALASGNSVVVAVGSPATSATALVDNSVGGNTYTPACSLVSGGYTWSIYYALNITNTPSIFTATVSSSVQFSTIVVSGFSGVASVDGTCAINPQSIGTGGTNSVTSGPTTTTANGDLVFGATVNVSGSGAITPGTGYTIAVNSSPDFVTEYQVQATAGAISATWTNAASDSFISAVIGFKHK